MKKALTFVVALAMLLSLCVVGTFAEGENAFVLTRVANVEDDALINVEIAVQTAGLVALAGQINFDKDAVEFVSFTAAKDFTTVVGPQSADAANEMGAVAFSADASTADADLTGLVKIGTAVFVLKADAAEVTFSGKADSACDKNLNDVAVDELAATAIDAAPMHDWADATCTAPKTCHVCGAAVGEALGHTPGAEATCTAAQVCTVCNAELASQLAHDFKDGKCTVCGAADPDFVAPGNPDGPKPDDTQKPDDPQNPVGDPGQKGEESVTGSVDIGTKPVVNQVLEDVKVEIAENVFPEDTKLVVEKIVAGERYEAVQKVFEKTFEKAPEKISKFVPYDISAIKNNVKVQPNGEVTVTFDIPENFDPARTAVYYISDDGKVEKIASTVDAASRKITATLTHFSTYVVAETETAKKEVPDTSSADGLAFAGLLSVLAAAAVVMKKKF